MTQKFKNRYSAIQLAIDANKAGIPAYPVKLDKNEWIVEYNANDMLLNKEEGNGRNNNSRF